MPRAKDTNLLETKRKSEVVTVRLDPKLKYLAELAARRQRRTLSSYIEWAIEDSLSHVNPNYRPDESSFDETFKDVANALWDVDEPDRFARLALKYPDLLDHGEQRLWKLVRECGLLWKGSYRGPDNEWQWTVREDSLIWERLREHWETFRRVAYGDADQSALPTWSKNKQAPLSQPQNSAPDFDDDIPF